MRRDWQKLDLMLKPPFRDGHCRDPLGFEIETFLIMRYQGLDSSAAAFTRTESYATCFEHVKGLAWDLSPPYIRGDRLLWKPQRKNRVQLVKEFQAAVTCG
mmetsp:Transcript_18228/g.38057  ORF Transcript_18228/g.38057 Transcript_18228/m.38057 type:complete len:101 (-) Transcript_18228:1501-1803(-)